jgi:hypothetical protein
MTLAEFQALFQARILAGPGDGDAPLLAALRESQRGVGRDDLLRVYQSGYRIRLEGFFHEDHGGLRALLGDAAFEALIQAFIAANPPKNPNARWYTTGLPDYMRQTAPWRDDGAALAMAFFERAVVDAFDAPDAEPLALQSLADFAPEDSPRLVFAFHPSLRILELRAGTLAAYQASAAEETEGDEESADAADETTGAGATRGDTEKAAVWRCNGDTAYRELEPDEHVALSEAMAGRAFGDICQMAAFQAGGVEPERLAQFLASWFEEGMITGVSLAQ